MSRVTKPLTIIAVAVIIAAATAVFLSRQSSAPVSENSADSPASLTSGGGHLRGPENAPFTLVEFGDYQCPSCAAYHPMVTEVMRRYPDKVRLEFHHFPLLSIHPNSMGAAIAAEAAGEQGRYWEMHDLLFEDQMQWAQMPNPEPEFIALANRAGLNANQFMKSLRSPEIQQRVLQDVVRGREAKVDAVPAFFVKGQHIPLPHNIQEFSQLVEQNLAGK